ncbi:unnamed protein product [Didymodactylos carnosus]|uniref:Uncharacterized protein n=1 Tax=Didymodactylos carnosus TaxID=1234261 RepID=A0A814BF13_9BILA|nr:unnamed protein product [Didymodactylos carnosus]CAF0925170.1 unnamed protein product [Didymodactylos carnosus]CAF3504969.1 unnamed protein product [Didymodactylos carnosus]CAF3703923.1 unnamed protein product [Didymodactylos carnosus]
MSTPPSGLSATAKEFIPSQPPPVAYYDSVDSPNLGPTATIYVGGLVGTSLLYPTQSACLNMSKTQLSHLPEIELHIQQHQTQHINLDSSQGPTSSSTSSTSPVAQQPSQIIFLPTNIPYQNYSQAISPSAQILYSTNLPPNELPYYPDAYDFIDQQQPQLVSFSLQPQQTPSPLQIYTLHQQAPSQSRYKQRNDQLNQHHSSLQSRRGIGRPSRGGTIGSFYSRGRGGTYRTNNNYYNSAVDSDYQYDNRSMSSSSYNRHGNSQNYANRGRGFYDQSHRYNERNSPSYNGPYSQSPYPLRNKNGSTGSTQSKRIPTSTSHPRGFPSYYQTNNNSNHRSIRGRGFTRGIPNSRSYNDQNDYDYADYNVAGEIDLNLDSDQINNLNNSQAQFMIDNNDVRPFEFRLEDFPSLPPNTNNHAVKNKQHVSHIHVNNTNHISDQPNENGSPPSWNTVVSTSRPRSSSPTSKSSSAAKQRSVSQHSQTARKSRNKTPPAITGKDSNDKKSNSNERNKTLTNEASLIQQRSISLNSNNQDNADFIQQKQSRRRRRKSKTKSPQDEEQLITESLPTASSEIVPFLLDDENAFPTLSNSPPTTMKKSVTNNTQESNDEQTNGPVVPITVSEKQSQWGTHRKLHAKPNTVYDASLTGMFDGLSTTSKQQEQHQKSSSYVQMKTNSLDSNMAVKHGTACEKSKQCKPTKLKHSINKELEENYKQQLVMKEEQPSYDTHNELNSMTDNNQQQHDEIEQDVNVTDEEEGDASSTADDEYQDLENSENQLEATVNADNQIKQ